MKITFNHEKTLSHAAPPEDHCPFCQARADQMLAELKDYHVKNGSSPDFSVFFCKTCQVGFSSPSLSDEEMADYYPAEYEAYIPKRGLWDFLQEKKYLMDVKRLVKLTGGSSGSIFEVGSGRGEFLAQVKKRGFTVGGIEPGEAGRRYALENFGISLQAGFAKELSFKQPNDCVVIRHVLEHVDRPEEVLQKVFQKGLRQGGALFLKLPNYNSWERSFFGKYWDGLDQPRHRFHFTKAGIKKMLEDTGFTDVQIKEEIVPNSIVKSISFAQKYGPPTAHALLRPYDFIPMSVKLLAFQGVALMCMPFEAARMIVTARKPQ